MTQGIAQLTLGFHPTLPVAVAFDAPQISSDGGVLLLHQTDERLGLSEWFAVLLPDERAAVRGVVKLVGVRALLGLWIILSMTKTVTFLGK